MSVGEVGFMFFLLGEELKVKVVVVWISMTTHVNASMSSRGGLGIFRSSQIGSDAIWDKMSF